eukprot:jgi/Psemu1/307974/fgenesh1_kg.367_\
MEDPVELNMDSYSISSTVTSVNPASRSVVSIATASEADIINTETQEEEVTEELPYVDEEEVTEELPCVDEKEIIQDQIAKEDAVPSVIDDTSAEPVTVDTSIPTDHVALEPRSLPLKKEISFFSKMDRHLKKKMSKKNQSNQNLLS